MSASWLPPRPAYHLRVFAGSLLLVVLGLLGLLFGVRMEALAPASGIIVARDLLETRALVDGLIEPGWYEGEIALPGEAPFHARLDQAGNGGTDPGRRPVLTFHHFQLVDGSQELRREALRFHRLLAGDILWPGQVAAGVRTDGVRLQLAQLEERLALLESGGQRELAQSVRVQRDGLRERVQEAVMHAPTSAESWLVLEVHVAPLQAVAAGDPIATLVPLEPATHRPRDLVARIEVDEKHGADLAPGQTVCLYSAVYNHRLHGRAEAVIERIEPWAIPGADGSRRFRIHAPITKAPFQLPLGSSFKAEVLVGRKPVYRIILEQ